MQKSLEWEYRWSSGLYFLLPQKVSSSPRCCLVQATIPYMLGCFPVTKFCIAHVNDTHSSFKLEAFSTPSPQEPIV